MNTGGASQLLSLVWSFLAGSPQLMAMITGVFVLETAMVIYEKFIRR